MPKKNWLHRQFFNKTTCISSQIAGIENVSQVELWGKIKLVVLSSY